MTHEEQATREAAILQMRENGDRLEDIGKRFGITKSAVSKIASVIKDKEPQSEKGTIDRLKRNKKIVQLYQNGYTMREIGTRISPTLSAWDVWQILQRMTGLKSDRLLAAYKEAFKRDKNISVEEI